MRGLFLVLIGLGLLSGCKDDAAVCDRFCGQFGAECLAQFDLPAADCLTACKAGVEEVGVGCLNAVSAAFECLGTCDVDSLEPAEVEACQDRALAAADACEEPPASVAALTAQGS